MLSILLSIVSISFCRCTNELRIHNASELVYFSSKVNSGTIYDGTTVFLENDIEFTDEESKLFTPIGTNLSNYFNGVFDGQGYLIGNLTVNEPSLNFVGFFGYSYGEARIRNIVIGSSCSFSRSSGSDIQVGGLVGYAILKAGPLVIENVVNMGNISFGGSCSNLYIGGIVGIIPFSSNQSATIRNCANYGSVTSTHGGLTYMGGIVGMSNGTAIKSIINCANYGAIIHDIASSDDVGIGGITGYGYNTSLKNCVSSGVIVPGPNENDIFVGSIIGNVSSGVEMTHCYWTSDTNCPKSYGTGQPSLESSTELITQGANYIGNLNGYAAENKLNYWLHNPENKSITFTINNSSGFVLSALLIVLPDLASDDGSPAFSGWYTEEKCENKLNLSDAINGDTVLYGGWQYTITLNATDGAFPSSSPEMFKTVVYGQKHGEFPDAAWEGYTLSGWYTETDGGERVESDTKVVIASNRTLYAQWTINNYTVTFDFNNRTTVNKTFTYNSSIEYPNVSEREGYVFDGWNNYHDYMPAKDITIAVLWVEAMPFVEITFGTVDLSKHEITEVLCQYTNSSFTIDVFEVDNGSGETRVIIKFNDAEKSIEFVRNVNTAIENGADSFIRKISALKEVPTISFSPLGRPLCLFLLFLPF